MSRHAFAPAAVVTLIAAFVPGRATAQETCERSFIQAQDRRDAGDLVGARAELRLCMNACATTIGAQCDAWLAEVEAGIAHVDLRVDPPDATVLIDDLPVLAGRLDLNPGKHRVAAKHPSRRPYDGEIDAKAGDGADFRIVLDALPAAAPPPTPARPAPVSAPTPADGSTLAIGLIIGGSALAATGLGLFVASQLDAQDQKYGDSDPDQGDVADDEWACLPDDCARERLVGLWVAAGATTAIGLALGATGIVVATTSQPAERRSSRVRVEPRAVAAGAHGFGFALRGQY